MNYNHDMNQPINPPPEDDPNVVYKVQIRATPVAPSDLPLHYEVTTVPAGQYGGVQNTLDEGVMVHGVAPPYDQEGNEQSDASAPRKGGWCGSPCTRSKQPRTPDTPDGNRSAYAPDYTTTRAGQNPPSFFQADPDRPKTYNWIVPNPDVAMSDAAPSQTGYDEDRRDSLTSVASACWPFSKCCGAPCGGSCSSCGGKRDKKCGSCGDCCSCASCGSCGICGKQGADSADGCLGKCTGSACCPCSKCCQKDKGGPSAEPFGWEDATPEQIMERNAHMSSKRPDDASFPEDDIKPLVVYGGVEHCPAEYKGEKDPMQYKLHAIELHQYIPLPSAPNPWFMQNKMNPHSDPIYGAIPLPFDPAHTGMVAPTFQNVVDGEPAPLLPKVITNMFNEELPVKDAQDIENENAAAMAPQASGSNYRTPA